MEMPTRDFPLEVLLNIFNYVYQLNRTNDPPPFTAPKFVVRDDDEIAIVRSPALGPEVWESVDIRSPSLFPYALERVSAHWRDAISGLPHCWTRIVIFYDDKDFSIADSVRSTIEFSRDTSPLEITVARRHSTSFVGAPHEEKVLLRQIIDLVAPHIHRCKSLVFSVAYPSSLPSLSADLYHAAPMLTTLSLEASLPSDLELASHTTQQHEFPFPALKTLTLSGWTFLDLVANARWWASRWISYYIRSSTLRVANYSPSLAPSALDPHAILIDAIPLLNNIITVEFENTSFDCIVQPSDILVPSVPSMQQLRLTDVDPKATKTFIDTLCPTSLHLTNCGLLAKIPLGSFFSIYFKGLSDVQGIVRALSSWKGEQLHFDHCTAFNDELLDALGNSAPHPRTSKPLLTAQEMSCLDLVDCRGFSIAALKRMVQRRKMFLAEHPVDEDDMLIGFRRAGIQITGRGVPDMTEDEMQWFKDNTHYFTWYGSQSLDG